MAGWCVAKAYKKGALLGAPFYNRVVGYVLKATHSMLKKDMSDVSLIKYFQQLCVSVRLNRRVNL